MKMVKMVEIIYQLRETNRAAKALIERARIIDESLLKHNASKFECELGEVVRMEVEVKRNENIISDLEATLKAGK